jgi:hypothetical protein
MWNPIAHKNEELGRNQQFLKVDGAWTDQIPVQGRGFQTFRKPNDFIFQATSLVGRLLGNAFENAH